MIRPLALALALCAAAPAWARPALRAVDGDTVAIGAERIRVMDYDSAELFSPKCGRERQLAIRARDDLQSFLDRGVTVERHGRDKYRRTLARLYDGNGLNVADGMVAAVPRHSRPYNGRGKRQGWCR